MYVPNGNVGSNYDCRGPAEAMSRQMASMMKKLQACIRTMAKSPGFPANAPVAPATAAQMTCNIDTHARGPQFGEIARLLAVDPFLPSRQC